MTTPEITNVTFAGAPDTIGQSELLGWVGFTLNGLVRIEGVTLRRSHEGALVLRYPTRRFQCDHQMQYVVPIDAATRHAIELQVFTALSTQVTP